MAQRQHRLSAPALDRMDFIITARMARWGLPLLRVSLGIVFVWFGALKFFPGLSPAQALAERTIETLAFRLDPPHLAVIILALWESLVGIGLTMHRAMRFTILLQFVQMAGTITPLFVFPSETFLRFPYAPTLEGQYIIKNLVLVAAGIVLGATVRGGTLIANQPRSLPPALAR